jgi:hypothetical protein
VITVTDIVSIESLTEGLRAVGDRRSDPGRLAVVLRRQDGSLVAVVDTAIGYDQARGRAIDVAHDQGARISLGNQAKLVRAASDPSTLPLPPATPLATVTLGQVSVRIQRDAATTTWTAWYGETRLLTGGTSGHESLSATVRRASSAAEHSPLLRSQPDVVIQLRALSSWALD